MSTPPDSDSRDKPVTIRDIAARAGVSAAAVSLALRNSPEVSEALHTRIQKLAQEMGYRPNPLVSAYQARVRSLNPVSRKATIAWINDTPQRDQWSKAHLSPLLEGARDRVGQIGYDLDEIWLPESEKPAGENYATRYETILLARGIHAAILPLIGKSELPFHPWRHCAVVCIGQHHTDGRTPLHHEVTHDDYANIRLSVDSLRQAGCKRIGLAISNYVIEESNGYLAAGFWERVRHLPESAHIPMFLKEITDAYPRQAAAWLKKHQPDAVIYAHPLVRRAVELAGLRVPEDIRMAHIHLAKDVEGWTGIDREWHSVGAAAVDLVSAHLTRNERGIPAYPKKMLVRGSWVEGET